ncbi:MAG: hypothetical protein KME35_01650 [Aphanocapsa sp. GSE-SYN-MK-11-07L]|nr:hypothetical protein [Aphanocapsa sp. GSE-SYN-MK-11-07L]
MPLILTRLSTEEIALWYLFGTIIGLQILADVGFSPTFSRIIAYGMGGRCTSELKDLRYVEKSNSSKAPNWETIDKICATMQIVYLRLTAVSISLLTIFGTWALVKPISIVPDSKSAWIAWGIILMASSFSLIGNSYSSYLQGANKIALQRRWEILTTTAGILTSIFVLILGGGLLGLVVANQSWLVLNVLRDRWLCKTIRKNESKIFKHKKIDSDVFEAVWASAWRSGLGALMSYGLIQLSGVFYAQVGTPLEVASYLLSLRLIQIVGLMSQAPFYSKLPLLAKLRSDGNLAEQVNIAKRGMRFAYWSYVVGFIGIGVVASPLLQLIGSKAEFVNSLLWGLMGLSMFAERYGGMHIQLYSTTNHIVWHIANGVSGVIYLVVASLLFRQIGIFAFPIGTLSGYLGFYCWYSATHSYKAFNLQILKFEKSTSLFPFIALVGYIILSIKF